jgi:hypothetical protein
MNWRSFGFSSLWRTLCYPRLVFVGNIVEDRLPELNPVIARVENARESLLEVFDAYGWKVLSRILVGKICATVLRNPLPEPRDELLITKFIRVGEPPWQVTWALIPLYRRALPPSQRSLDASPTERVIHQWLDKPTRRATMTLSCRHGLVGSA